MMKRITTLLLLTIGMVGYSKADRLIVNDVTLERYQAEIRINYQFDVAEQYSGFQLVLELPEGVSTVKDEHGAPEFIKGECLDNSYTISSNYLEGTDRFAALSLSSIPMTGTSGLLLSIPIVCDKDWEVGTTLQGTLSGIAFGKTDGLQTVYMPDIVFAITVGEPWITLDENAAEVPIATNEAVELLVKRTIPANQWNTICLPFAMTKEQVYEAFGEDVELAEFWEYSVNEDITHMEVVFESADLDEYGFLANYPYIIKTSKDVNEFKVETILEPNEEDAYCEYSNKRKVYGTFYGTLKSGTVLPANSVFLNGGNFWYSAGKSKIKAFRGYFDFVHILDEATISSQMTLTFKNGTTGVETVVSYSEDDKWYDLQGREVKKPVRGVYIQKGKKIMVK